MSDLQDAIRVLGASGATEIRGPFFMLKEIWKVYADEPWAWFDFAALAAGKTLIYGVQIVPVDEGPREWVWHQNWRRRRNEQPEGSC